MYKYPHYCKYIAIGCIVIWSLLCAIITSLWCLWFDAQLFLGNNYESEIDYYSTNCSSSLYTYTTYASTSVVPYKTYLNYNLTETEMDFILSNFDGYLYSPPSSNDSFGDNYNVAQRFLLCVLLSYILSVFFWQPIILAIKSAWLLRSYVKNPDRFTEGSFFYSQNLNSDDAVNTAERGSVDNSKGLKTNEVQTGEQEDVQDENDENLKTIASTQVKELMDNIDIILKDQRKENSDGDEADSGQMYSD